MEFLKSRRVTSKLAMGLLLGSSLISASIAGTPQHSTCSQTAAACSTFSAKDCPVTSAQYGSTAANTTSGWYPCSVNSSACQASSNNDAYCSTYQCSTNLCSSYKNEGSCLSALVVSKETTTGKTCVWERTIKEENYSCKDASILVAAETCGNDTPNRQ